MAFADLGQFRGTSGEYPLSQEIVVPQGNILRHFFSTEKAVYPEQRIAVIPTEQTPPPIFTGRTYLANIGSAHSPLLLELRFEEVDLKVKEHGGANDPYLPAESLGEKVKVNIALLMTNERHWRDLALMGEEMYRRTQERGIDFDAIVSVDSLGPRLSQEMARAAWEHDGKDIYMTSIQKGKPHVNSEGVVKISTPKPWIKDDAGVEMNSGTSHANVRQRLYLDQQIAGKMRERGMRVLLVDDARLTQGSINAGIELLHRQGLEVTGIATVLNEAGLTDNIEGIPYIGLTKLPLFAPVPGGRQPIMGSYEGLDNFYIEV